MYNGYTYTHPPKEEIDVHETVGEPTEQKKHKKCQKNTKKLTIKNNQKRQKNT
jgi:hypothetical protein